MDLETYTLVQVDGKESYELGRVVGRTPNLGWKIELEVLERGEIVERVYEVVGVVHRLFANKELSSGTHISEDTRRDRVIVRKISP